MWLRSCLRVHVLFLFRWQWAFCVCWNKTFGCSFQAQKHGCDQTQERSWCDSCVCVLLPGCTDTGTWWGADTDTALLPATSRPTGRSMPVRTKPGSDELVWRFHMAEQMHKKYTGNIPCTWLLLPLGREPFASADLLTTEKARTSVHCQTNRLCTTSFPLTCFDKFCACSAINLSSSVLVGWCWYTEAASTRTSTVPIRARLWTTEVFMTGRQRWRVGGRFSRLLQDAAPNYRLIFIRVVTLRPSDVRGRTTPNKDSDSDQLFHPVQKLGY